jgi:transcriptional regulator with XRE-family HTH domain
MDRRVIDSGQTRLMEDLRIGRVGRALRHRLGARQSDLAERIGMSQGEISLFERGRIDRMPVATVRRILAGLDAELVLSVRWRGGDLDRLLDMVHCQLAEDVSRVLLEQGWEVAPEVSYSIFGERGSIDLVAWQQKSETLLIVEVKSEITSVEETFRKHDEKTRLEARIVSERFGWIPRVTARLLVVPEQRTIRRQAESRSTLFGRMYPSRNVAVRHWLRRPSGPMSGILFLPATNRTRGERGRGRRKRVQAGRPRSDRTSSARQPARITADHDPR